MEISPDMQSLLEKLDGLELTEGERASFGQLMGLEDDGEVEGFAHQMVNRTVQGFNTGVGLDYGEYLVDDTFQRRVAIAGGTRVVDHKADD